MAENISALPIILAVDDSVIMQNTIKLALEKDYKVLIANHALDALAVIYHEKISLLLLDISMPGIDGLELCRTIRQLPNFSDLPIVMVTARDKMVDKVQGRLAGATEYLTKPFQSEKLQEVVKRLIS
jgi:CheY-like chemotaxis protein